MLLFVLIFLIIVVLMQVSCGVIRRANTANLTESVTVRTVASALRGGVEWGNGFTQFPEDFSVQEADENTGRVEVTVTDTTSKDVLECYAGSSVQAQAFAINALLNPRINTVVYHVSVHRNDQGELQKSQLFGFLKPGGDATPIFTFTFSKTQSSDGVNITMVITGANNTIQEELRDQIATVRVLGGIVGGDSSSKNNSTTGTTSTNGTSGTNGNTTNTNGTSNTTSSGK